MMIISRKSEHLIKTVRSVVMESTSRKTRKMSYEKLYEQFLESYCAELFSMGEHFYSNSDHEIACSF